MLHTCATKVSFRVCLHGLVIAGLLAAAGRQALECARFKRVACAQLNHASAIIACSCDGVLAVAFANRNVLASCS